MRTPPTRQLNVRLSTDLIVALKHAAVTEGVTLHALVEELLTKGPSRLESENSSAGRGMPGSQH